MTSFFNNQKSNQNNQKSNVKVNNILQYKEQFKYLKTTHSYHLVDPSPWPAVASLGAFMITSGLVLYMHKFIGGWTLFQSGFLLTFYVMYTWWRDVIREATFEEQHTVAVQKGLRLGMVLFIVSEIMFFFAFFWAFFHSSIAPVYSIGGVWPPKAITPMDTYTIPLTNTFFLLTSGATVTWAHHALVARAKKQALLALTFTLILAVLFTSLQGLEYVEAAFNISDGVYGSCFYMATGFHGFHVFVGTIALLVSFVRIVFNHFTNHHHFGFESAIWYWHFVDVVWLFLFINVYWWSNSVQVPIPSADVVSNNTPSVTGFDLLFQAFILSILTFSLSYAYYTSFIVTQVNTFYLKIVVYCFLVWLAYYSFLKQIFMLTIFCLIVFIYTLYYYLALSITQKFSFLQNLKKSLAANETVRNYQKKDEFPLLYHFLSILTWTLVCSFFISIVLVQNSLVFQETLISFKQNWLAFLFFFLTLQFLYEIYIIIFCNMPIPKPKF